MPKFKHHEKLLLQDSVREAVRYFGSRDNKNSLRYIEKQFGRPISEPTLERYRKKIKSDANITQWLSEQARVANAVEHRELIDEIKDMVKDVWQEYKMEVSKEISQRDTVKLDTLRRQILAINKRRAELVFSSPIIAQAKAMIDKKYGNTNTNGNKRPEEPSIGKPVEGFVF